MSTASEQPGPGLPEDDTANTASTSNTEPAEAVDAAEPVRAAADLPPDLPESPGVQDRIPDADAETESEEARVARERAEFDKLVEAFHGESAPDPQPDRPSSAATRKIVRYPILEPRPEWPAEIVEPTDETTVDPLDHVEHYEQPDPPLPRADAATLASWTMLIGGVLFLLLHTLLRFQASEYLSWLAVIGVFGGIISLVVRMKPDRDEYDDPDNGAVV